MQPLNNLSTVETSIDTDGTSNECETVAKKLPARELQELNQTIRILESLGRLGLDDHYVAVLKVTDSAVIVGDPLNEAIDVLKRRT